MKNEIIDKKIKEYADNEFLDKINKQFFGLYSDDFMANINEKYSELYKYVGKLKKEKYNREIKKIKLLSRLTLSFIIIFIVMSSILGFIICFNLGIHQ